MSDWMTRMSEMLDKKEKDYQDRISALEMKLEQIEGKEAVIVSIDILETILEEFSGQNMDNEAWEAMIVIKKILEEANEHPR